MPVPSLSWLIDWIQAHRPVGRLSTHQLSRLGTGLVLGGLLIYAGCQAGDPVPPPGPSTRPAATLPAASPAPSPGSTPSPGSVPGPGSTTSPGSVPGAGEACVQQAFTELTAAQRAGQLVMSGVPAGDPAQYRSLVAEQRLGSVFLAGRSGDSPATVRKGLARLPVQRTRTTTIRLLVSVDQEGGSVQALRGRNWTSIPSAKTQGSWSTDLLTRRTQSWVKQLRGAGVSMDLAPVADTVPAGTESRNPPIGRFGRQYASTPADGSRAVTTVTAVMRDGGVIPTLKHFPGLGLVRYNTDTSSRAVDSTTTVTSANLTPFRSGIEAGAGAVMISSARYPKIDPKNPAVFSAPVITGLLRTRLTYQGVVMTDDVGRAVAVRSVPVGQRATRFINAGGDLVLTVVPERAPTMVRAIVAEAQRSSTFRAKVNTSTVRVLRLKQQSGLLTCT